MDELLIRASYVKVLYKIFMIIKSDWICKTQHVTSTHKFLSYSCQRTFLLLPSHTDGRRKLPRRNQLTGPSIYLGPTAAVYKARC